MDYQIFQFFNTLAGHYKWLDDLGIFMAAYSQYFIGAGIIAFMVVRTNATNIWKNFKITAYFFVTAIVSRFVFGQIIKMVINRPRPFQTHQVLTLIAEDPGQSFPSGHMAFFFAFSTAVYFYNKKAGIICYIASLLMGLSRIFVGVHYPSDILGGMVLGVLVGWAAGIIFKKIQRAEKSAILPL